MFQHSDSIKLYISFFYNLSNIFTTQKSEKYTNDKYNEINSKLLLKVCKKVNIFLSKYSNFNNREKKGSLEKEEILNIINNFNYDIQEYRQYYIAFFVRFFSFVEMNFKLELDLKYRKKIYGLIFEMFYEIIVLCFIM